MESTSAIPSGNSDTNSTILPAPFSGRSLHEGAAAVPQTTRAPRLLVPLLPLLVFTDLSGRCWLGQLSREETTLEFLCSQDLPDQGVESIVDPHPGLGTGLHEGNAVVGGGVPGLGHVDAAGRQVALVPHHHLHTAPQ